jgi:hypothetical protein
MNSNLYRLVYCSRNRIRGTAEEVNDQIRNILASSRTNNARQGVTGALLYNDGNFAQALEGPLAAVEQIFEKIQCDERHSEVIVVQSGRVEEREFPDWSMAFTGGGAADRLPVAATAFDAVFADSANAKEQILPLLQKLIVQEDDWILVAA